MNFPSVRGLIGKAALELGQQAQEAGQDDSELMALRPTDSIDAEQLAFLLRHGAGDYVLGGGGAEDGEASPALAETVSYRGPSAEPRPEIAREMEERLRALGYIR